MGGEAGGGSVARLRVGGCGTHIASRCFPYYKKEIGRNLPISFFLYL